MEGFKQEGTLSNSGLSDTVLIAVWETVEKHKDKECIHQVGGGAAWGWRCREKMGLETH